MKKIIEKKESGGKLDVIEDLQRHLFLARPHGFINPSILNHDLQQAKDFSEKCDDHWTYVTNTEDIKLVNPLTIYFLKEIKKLKRLKQIVVFAPGWVNRILIRLASPIVRPDRVIKNKNEFQRFLKNVS